MNLFTIDDLHFSVNDIHEQWDDGTISYDEAEQILLRVCFHFINKSKGIDNDYPKK
jgi:hypothetical protein